MNWWQDKVWAVLSFALVWLGLLAPIPALADTCSGNTSADWTEYTCEWSLKAGKYVCTGLNYSATKSCGTNSCTAVSQCGACFARAAEGCNDNGDCTITGPGTNACGANGAWINTGCSCNAPPAPTNTPGPTGSTPVPTPAGCAYWCATADQCAASGGTTTTGTCSGTDVCCIAGPSTPPVHFACEDACYGYVAAVPGSEGCGSSTVTNVTCNNGRMTFTNQAAACTWSDKPNKNGLALYNINGDQNTPIKTILMPNQSNTGFMDGLDCNKNYSFRLSPQCCNPFRDPGEVGSCKSCYRDVNYTPPTATPTPTPTATPTATPTPTNAPPVCANINMTPTCLLNTPEQTVGIDANFTDDAGLSEYWFNCGTGNWLIEHNTLPTLPTLVSKSFSGILPLNCRTELTNAGLVTVYAKARDSARVNTWDPIAAGNCQKNIYYLANPSSFTASDGAACDRINLVWSAVVGATSYRIYRDTEMLTQQVGTSFSDIYNENLNPLAPVTHNYKVTAVLNICGETSGATDVGSLKTTPISELSCSDKTSSSFTANWKNSNSCCDSVLFENKTTQSIETLPGNTTNHTVNSLAPDTTYNLEVSCLQQGYEINHINNLCDTKIIAGCDTICYTTADCPNDGQSWICKQISAGVSKCRVNNPTWCVDDTTCTCVPTNTPTATPTPTATATPTPTPTATATPTATGVPPTNTPTPTPQFKDIVGYIFYDKNMDGIQQCTHSKECRCGLETNVPSWADTCYGAPKDPAENECCWPTTYQADSSKWQVIAGGKSSRANWGGYFLIPTFSTGTYQVNISVFGTHSVTYRYTKGNSLPATVGAGNGRADFGVTTETATPTPVPLAPWWQVWGGHVYGKNNVNSNNMSINQFLLRNDRFLTPNSAGIPISLSSVAVDGNRFTEHSTLDRVVGQSDYICTNYTLNNFKRQLNINSLSPHEGNQTSVSLEDLNANATVLPNSTLKIYYLVGNLTLNLNSTWEATNDLIIFVEGSVSINQSGSVEKLIELNDEHFLGIIASGNVTFENNVGYTDQTTTPNATNNYANWNGWVFSTDGLIISDTTSNPNTEKKLILYGSYIGCGGVELNRQLNSVNDNNNPAELFIYNPILMSQIPSELKESKIVWQEGL